MATTIRAQIIEAVKTRMATITTGNSYEVTVKRVDDFRSMADAYQQTTDSLPAINVLDASDDWAPMAAGQYRYEHTLTVVIHGATVPGSTAPISGRALTGAIHKAVSTDITWGGLAQQTIPVSDNTVIEEAERKVCGVQCTFQIKYHTIGLDPYTQG